jgi:uncharacterized protein
MKILVRQIGPEGIILQESFPADVVGMEQIDVLRFLAPFEVKAKVLKVENEIIATVTAASRYATFCARCLEEMELDWSIPFTLTFDTKEYAEFIEIDEEIRQELILNLPARVLCRDDCKGLCVDCGVNLNKQACPHKHAVIKS